jgi:hypothetical protein
LLESASTAIAGVLVDDASDVVDVDVVAVVVVVDNAMTSALLVVTVASGTVAVAAVGDASVVTVAAVVGEVGVRTASRWKHATHSARRAEAPFS